MSSEDCSVLDIREGDRVRVESPDGAIERAVKIERGLSPGIIAVPRGFAGNDVMNLLPLKDAADPDFPGSITCPAKITVVSQADRLKGHDDQADETSRE